MTARGGHRQLLRRGGRRVSVLRLAAVLLVAAGMTAGAYASVRRAIDIVAPARSGPWYAPYVDVTLTPEYHFEDLAANPSNDVVLSFIVAGRAGACVPTWGTYYDLDGARSALDLDRRIVRLRQRGGDVIVSFGGAANDELARRCDVTQLTNAYSAVIGRYRPTTIDFDIEGASLGDVAANERRATATRKLQAAAASARRRLAVWLTLPVTPSGLPDDALAVVTGMLRARVDLAGVNLMTMNFGATRGERTMVDASRDALKATWRQLDGAYRANGMRLSSRALWRKLGMTPMIGQNDEPGDRVTVSEAKQLLQLAQDLGLGRVSMWSLNRDTDCGAQLDIGMVSQLCSGVAQKPLDFTYIFDRLPGRSARAAALKTVAEATDPRDDPAKSPYAIWSEDKVYTKGSKITWHRNVYQAKWWSHANVPDEPVRHEWDTPWRYLGPVLPGDHPAPKLPRGTYPPWSPKAVYIRGDRVQVGRTAYEAKWWTQAERPGARSERPWDSPWEELDPGQLKRH